ncbi:MAG: cell division protein FtsW [Anaerolineales bacterium]|nr:cell division protein FtsW [Anaerolineales bacterium]
MFRTMGERVTVNPVPRTSRRQARQPITELLGAFAQQPDAEPGLQARAVDKRRVVQLNVDVPLLFVAITLMIFGLIMVFSASYDYSLSYYKNPNFIFHRQILWTALGIAGVLFLTYLDYHHWRRLAVPAIAVTVFLLLGVLFVSEIYNNAVRTLYEGSAQPSELAKLITVIYLAVWLYARRGQLSDMSFGLVPLGMILGVLGGLIMLQPDLSAMLTIIFLGGLMFFLGGGDLKQIGVLMVLAILVGLIVFALYPTGKTRIHDYWMGLVDPIQGSYHVQRSFDAFINGGWFGVGIGKGEAKVTGLPVPHTDSIFAVVGEETGLLGAVGVVGLYVVFLWRGLVISRRAPDELGALLAAGLTLWISMEAFINMAVMVNLLPFAGNALPFISAGGSSLTVSMAAVGILLNISRLSVQRKEENGKTFNAVVNMRGRDRGRRVSSARRPASSGSRVSPRANR